MVVRCGRGEERNVAPVSVRVRVGGRDKGLILPALDAARMGASTGTDIEASEDRAERVGLAADSFGVVIIVGSTAMPLENTDRPGSLRCADALSEGINGDNSPLARRLLDCSECVEYCLVSSLIELRNEMAGRGEASPASSQELLGSAEGDPTSNGVSLRAPKSAAFPPSESECRGVGRRRGGRRPGVPCWLGGCDFLGVLAESESLSENRFS